MTLILSSCKRGRWPLLISKCGAGVIFAWILTILFALLNLLVFGLLCGFDGWGSPLYAIESYQYTPFSGSILLFYGLICGLKAIGFSVTALLLILLSACFQKSLYSRCCRRCIYFASGCVDLEEKEPLHEGKRPFRRFADHSRALLCLCHRYFYYSWIWTSCRESDSYCTIENVPIIHY